MLFCSKHIMTLFENISKIEKELEKIKYEIMENIDEQIMTKWIEKYDLENRPIDKENFINDLEFIKDMYEFVEEHEDIIDIEVKMNMMEIRGVILQLENVSNMMNNIIKLYEVTK